MLSTDAFLKQHKPLIEALSDSLAETQMAWIAACLPANLPHEKLITQSDYECARDNTLSLQTNLQETVEQALSVNGRPVFSLPHETEDFLRALQPTIAQAVLDKLYTAHKDLLTQEAYENPRYLVWLVNHETNPLIEGATTYAVAAMLKGLADPFESLEDTRRELKNAEKDAITHQAKACRAANLLGENETQLSPAQSRLLWLSGAARGTGYLKSVCEGEGLESHGFPVYLGDLVDGSIIHKAPSTPSRFRA